MTLDGDTDQAAGTPGETPTLPAESRVDDAADDDDDDDDDAGSDSESMDALLAAVAAAPPVRFDRPQSVGIEPGTLVDGTYRVLRRLGGGGMGVVYLAEHVELQRQVALKLHLGELDSQELARLRREARVMARLSHPNVLAVHGVGTHDGRMFIAMEFAEGGTLKTWLEAEGRPWRETVEMLAQAGRGLAAAHRVGVVHRDFKPDNVLIGADGRPRVADFGLARRWDESFELATGESSSSASLVPLEDAHRFTVTGAVVGTPAYMSPEQFDGIEVGPGSDQFSFCVVLYEALLGRRPFSGRTTMELAAAVHMGKIRPVPSGARVPKRLLALVTRGLRPVPGDRHPSMEALVEALERAAGARARRTRWAMGGFTLGAALLVGNRVAVMSAPAPCEGAEQGLAPAWDDARREAVTAAWPTSGAAEQGPALAAIDAWAGEWRAQRREVCEATRVREEQSELVFTLRMACLARMEGRLDAFTEELATGHDGEPTAELVRSSLPSLSTCEDVELLSGLYNRFSTDTLRGTAEQDRAWAEGEALLTRAYARRKLGRPGAEALAEQALALAQRSEAIFVEIWALSFLADERVQQGKTAEAEALAERGLQLALGVGQGDAAADIVLSRAEAATSAGRTDEAAIHLSYFEAVAARIHDPERVAAQSRRARIVRGMMHLRRGEPGDALALLAPLADDPLVEVEKRITALNALGAAYEELGRPEEAIAAWTRLVALVEAEQGPDAVGLVGPLNNLATVRIAAGELDAALADLTRAEAIATHALGVEHPFVASILTNRGLAERERGRLAEAHALQERSLALRTRIHGEAHPSLAYPLDELGALARLRGEHAVALEQLARARRLREEGLGAEHPLVADTLVLEARVLLDMGEPARARATLERALGIVGREDGDPVDRAEAELLLARATEAADLTAARGLAVAAEEHAAAAGVAGRAVGDEARAWLAAHPAATVGSDAPR